MVDTKALVTSSVCLLTAGSQVEDTWTQNSELSAGVLDTWTGCY